MSTVPGGRPDQHAVLEMVKKYQQSGSQASLTWLLNEHRDMCYSIAGKYKHRFEVDDTFQDCMESLIHTINDFDVDGGYAFFSHAYIRVSREVARKKIQQWNIVSVPDTKGLMTVFRKIRKMEIPQNPSEAQAKEIAKILDVKVEYVYAASSLFHKDAVSLDSGIFSDGLRATLLDESSPESIVSEQDFEVKRTELAQRMMGQLNERQALVIQLRHLNEPPLKLREVGEELGISAARVQQIETRAMKVMMAA